MLRVALLTDRHVAILRKPVCAKDRHAAAAHRRRPRRRHAPHIVPVGLRTLRSRVAPHAFRRKPRQRPLRLRALGAFGGPLESGAGDCARKCLHRDRGFAADHHVGWRAVQSVAAEAEHGAELAAAGDGGAAVYFGDGGAEHLHAGGGAVPGHGAVGLDHAARGVAGRFVVLGADEDQRRVDFVVGVAARTAPGAGEVVGGAERFWRGFYEFWEFFRFMIFNTFLTISSIYHTFIRFLD